MKETENFLDKNTLIAVVLVFVAWFAWDSYMRKKYPKPPVTDPALISKDTDKSKDKNLPEGFKSRGGAPLKKSFKRAGSKDRESSLFKKTGSKDHRGTPFKKALKKPKKERVFSFESEELSFEISSQGMGLKNVVLNQILDRRGKPVWLFLSGKNLSFETGLMGLRKEKLYFDIKPSSNTSWEGIALWNGVEIRKKLSVKPSQFLIRAELQATGDLRQISGLSTTLIQKREDQSQKKSILSFFILPDFSSFFVSSSRGFEQIHLISEEDFFKENKNQTFFTKVRAVALGTKYFGQAWIEDASDVLPRFQADFKDKNYLGLINHSVLNPQKNFEISHSIFIGPKDFLFLKKEYPSLVHWVDFGWFGSLSRFILLILRFFYSIVGNWGISIILLTLLVRLLLLPLALSSHRSMEGMKKAHPEIQKAREKFKKDPQRMNQEVMAIMKSHRANPLGGCLPLLLQIPVFWALWKALSNSYSLYRAPFVFWIQDLSWKDPYYVLPILMGVLMFVQQKITPVTMSKEMLRAMQIMPIFMIFFMLNLPSGLTLYMLISAVFGLMQQMYLNKPLLSKPLLNKPLAVGESSPVRKSEEGRGDKEHRENSLKEQVKKSTKEQIKAPVKKPALKKRAKKKG